MGWPANIRTWVSGETVTAALLNGQLRDALKAIGDPWQNYTPAWTAVTTNPTLGNGTKTGSFLQAGKLVIFRITITFGSSTTAGSGIYSFSLPATSIDNKIPLGQAMCWDNSATSLSEAITFIDNSTFTECRLHTTTTGANVTGAAPFTWATNDEININGMYEAA